jgi:hypothetical protein
MGLNYDWTSMNNLVDPDDPERMDQPADHVSVWAEAVAGRRRRPDGAPAGRQLPVSKYTISDINRLFRLYITAAGRAQSTGDPLKAARLGSPREPLLHLQANRQHPTYFQAGPQNLTPIGPVQQATPVQRVLHRDKRTGCCAFSRSAPACWQTRRARLRSRWGLNQWATSG